MKTTKKISIALEFKMYKALKDLVESSTWKLKNGEIAGTKIPSDKAIEKAREVLKMCEGE